jgi:ABC-type polysaccharide/polyol phosphate transport system ATPase subunit
MGTTPHRSPAILAEGVSKTFRMPREQVHTLKERALHPLRRTGESELPALRDVSFEVGHGEFFGICGRNGSGKSTLLKCLAGIYATDAGRIWVNGRMSTFIELGVGFNPDLPARDNVAINATMLGLSPREARRRYDAVMDFAELRDYAELKIKNYSSGMLVRLAFAVMIQVDADILIIDEVLAVGDAAFQQKCFEEFERVRDRGSTVILVTHDMSAVQRFCDRALLLEHGREVTVGAPEEVGNRYLELNFSEKARAIAAGEEAPDTNEPEDEHRFGDGRAQVIRGWFEDEDGREADVLQAGRRCAFVADVRYDEAVENPALTVNLSNTAHLQVFGGSSLVADYRPGLFCAGEVVRYRFEFDNVFHQDRYWATASLQAGTDVLDYRLRFCSVMVKNVVDSASLVELPYEASFVRRETVETTS